MEFFKDLKDQILGYYDDIIVVLPKFGLAVLVVALFLFISSLLRKRIIKYFTDRASDKLIADFLNSVFSILNFTIAFLLFLYIVGQWKIAGSILGAATFSSIIVGLAFKDIGENFLAGIIMAFNRPFRLGDTIMTGDVEGTIREMSLRETHVKTFDGKDVYVPNAQIIKNPLYNYTIDGFLRKQFTVGIDYGEDMQKARDIIDKTMSTIPGILQEEKPPITLIKEFGSSTVTVVVQFWLDTFDTEHSSVEVQSQAMSAVLKALADSDIAMPGDIIELKNYKDSPIKTDIPSGQQNSKSA